MTWLDHLTNAGKFVSDGIDKFNTFKKEHGDPKSWKDVKIQKLLESDTIQSYLKSTGVSHGEPEEVVQKGGFFSGISGGFKRIAQMFKGDHGLLNLVSPDKLAGIAAAGASVAGDLGQENYGSALSTLLTEGTKMFSTAAPGGLVRGQWVVVDNGEEKHTKKDRANMFWGEGAMFGDMMTPEEEEETMDHVYTVGFVVEPSVGDGETDVFDLETGDTRRFRLQSVRPAPAERASILESSEEMRIIKDVILDENKVALRVVAATPIDPGSEVTYNGKVWNVLESSGTAVRIQCGEETLTVDANKLGRGRTDHSNVWHYGEETPDGFDRDVKAGLHRGMWVWVRPREKITKLYPESEWELGIVRLLTGYQIDGYYAMDGERMVANEADVKVVRNEQDEWLNKHKYFKQFRNEAVVGGHSVRSFAIGQHYPRLCAGVGAVGPREAHQHRGRHRGGGAHRPGEDPRRPSVRPRCLGDCGRDGPRNDRGRSPPLAGRRRAGRPEVGGPLGRCGGGGRADPPLPAVGQVQYGGHGDGPRVRGDNWGDLLFALN